MVGSVHVDKDEVEAPASELHCHGPTENNGPLTVNAAEILGPAQAESVGDEVGGNGGEVQCAKAGQQDEPDWCSHRSTSAFWLFAVIAQWEEEASRPLNMAYKTTDFCQR